MGRLEPAQLETLDNYLREGYRPDDAAVLAGCARATAYKRRQEIGIEGKRYNYPPEKRAEVERLLLDGHSLRQVCRLTGVAWGSVHRTMLAIGLPPQHSIGYTGVPMVVEFLRSQGHTVEIMPHLHRFDLLIDGRPYELKCSNLLVMNQNGCRQYCFSISGNASGAKPSDYVTVKNGVAYKDYSKTCEYLLGAGFQDGRLTHLYRFDSKEIQYGKRSLKVNPNGQKYQSRIWYEVE